MGIAQIGFYFFAWDLGVNFLGIQIFQDLRFRKKFFKKIQILGVIEKCIGWFLLCLFLGGFFIKRAKKICIYDYVKSGIGTF